MASLEKWAQTPDIVYPVMRCMPKPPITAAAPRARRRRGDEALRLEPLAANNASRQTIQAYLARQICAGIRHVQIRTLPPNAGDTRRGDKVTQSLHIWFHHE